MVSLKNIFSVAMGMVLFLAGCDACVKPLPKKSEDHVALQTTSEAGRLTIDSQAIFAKARHFSYRSELIVSVGKPGFAEVDKEIIDVVGTSPRLLFKKKIDDYHFFEIFKDEDSFFIKNHGGAWRKSLDNQPMYEGLVKDGLNVTAWIIEQFGLNDQIAAKVTNASKAKTLTINDVPNLKSSVFIQRLMNKVPNFRTIDRTTFSGTIAMDEKTDLPVSAKFQLEITGPEQAFIKLNASMTLTMASAGESLALPLISDDEPVAVPVNIVPRFNELMENELGHR